MARKSTLYRLFCGLAGCSAALLGGCAPGGSQWEADEEIWLGEPPSAAADWAAGTFEADNVLDTASMVDADAMSVAEVQAFLDENPYGWQSVLAEHSSNGSSAAEAFVNAAQANQINPLVLLTRAQMEQSLIGRTSVSQATLDKAMGCGCPDNQPCQQAYQGFDKQLDCAASKLRSYLDDLGPGGLTVAGWGVGITKTTLDGYSITPVNEATAALYTYTPWLSAAKLHSQIWALYAAYIGYTGPVGGGAEPPPGQPEEPVEPPVGPLDLIIDDDPAGNGDSTQFAASDSWIATSATPGHLGTGYHYRTTGPSSDLASFRVYLEQPTVAVIEAWWTAGGNRATAAPFLVYDGNGSHIATVHANQQQDGSQWVALGTFSLTAGWNTVALSRWTSSGDVVIADAVRVRAAE